VEPSQSTTYTNELQNQKTNPENLTKKPTNQQISAVNVHSVSHSEILPLVKRVFVVLDSITNSQNCPKRGRI
jgi:hypothetical protein